MNNKEKLLEYVRNNWKKIPYLCNLSEEGLKEFLETGYTNKTGRDMEYITISKIKDMVGNEFDVIKSYVLGYDEETGFDENYISSQMSLKDDGTFSGIIYGDTDIRFLINDKGEVNFKSSSKYKDRAELLEHLIQNKTIVTHFGDDLDNKSSIYAIEKFLRILGVLGQNENLTVERVPAGQVKEGFVNVDTGGHRGNRVDNETKTIVIDGDPKNGIKSACESLSKLGIYVPEQICELADSRPTQISALDSRSGLALVRYLSGGQAFDLAENGLLDKTLTDGQLEKYGLMENHLKQQELIDRAVEKINKYTVELPNGEKIVLAPEQITAGSSIAYEMGIPYYASTSQHCDREGNPDGVTFAISCKPGMKLPKEILEYGRQLVEQYRIDEMTSGVFINPNEQLIVAGGPKNPNFRIEGHTPESMLEELRTVLSPSKEDAYINQIVDYATKTADLREKNAEAEKLAKNYENQLPTSQQSLENE